MGCWAGGSIGSSFLRILEEDAKLWILINFLHFVNIIAQHNPSPAVIISKHPQNCRTTFLGSRLGFIRSVGQKGGGVSIGRKGNKIMILLIWIGIAHFTASISLLSLPGAPITADRRFHHFCDYLIFTTHKSHQQISRHTPLTLTATTKPTSLQPAVVEYKISHYRTQHSTLNPTQIAHKTAPGTHKNTPLADYFPFLCQIMN